MIFFPHHGYLNISMAIWLGMYLFFILERCLRIFMDARSRRQGISFNHSHTHTNTKPTEEQESLVQLKVSSLHFEVGSRESFLISLLLGTIYVFSPCLWFIILWLVVLELFMICSHFNHLLLIVF